MKHTDQATRYAAIDGYSGFVVEAATAANPLEAARKIALKADQSDPRVVKEVSPAEAWFNDWTIYAIPAELDIYDGSDQKVIRMVEACTKVAMVRFTDEDEDEDEDETFVIERDDCMEWTTVSEGEAITSKTTHKSPGNYARLDDYEEKGLGARYPQICEGGGLRGYTIDFATDPDLVAECFAHDVGGRLYRTERGYKAAIKRALESY